MAQPKNSFAPNILRHIATVIYEEFFTFISIARFSWPMFIAFCILFTFLIYYTHPFPPSRIRIAAGQPNSSLENLCKEYAKEFKEHGIKLEIINTNGATDSYSYLENKQVDAALSISGFQYRNKANNIASLGSVEYQPFWLFYKADYQTKNHTHFFQSGIFSINLPGSGTRELAKKYLHYMASMSIRVTTSKHSPQKRVLKNLTLEISTAYF